MTEKQFEVIDYFDSKNKPIKAIRDNETTEIYSMDNEIEANGTCGKLNTFVDETEQLKQFQDTVFVLINEMIETANHYRTPIISLDYGDDLGYWNGVYQQLKELREILEKEKDNKMTKKLVELEKSEDNPKKCEYPSIRLSRLVKEVVELKALALCPNSDSIMRDKLYKKINHLESLLLELKDINVELKRDWWEE